MLMKLSKDEVNEGFGTTILSKHIGVICLNDISDSDVNNNKL